MKKGLTLSIIVIIALSAMIGVIKKENYTPFYTEKQQAHTNYQDNLEYEEKAEIGLMGVTSLTKLINTVTKTYEYAEKVIKVVTNFLDKDSIKNSIKDWWKLPLPLMPKIRG